MGLLGRLRGRSEPGRESVPGWASLELGWREAEFCVIDLEATGLDLKRDQIVSYGSVIVRGGRIIARSARYGLVRPSVEVSEAALKVHALTAADLAQAPGVDACAEALAQELRGRVLVAHAAWVERAFINRIFAGVSLRLDGPIVDTAALARECRLEAARTHEAEPSLERLAIDLNLPVHTPHHALGDALTTAEVLLATVARLSEREERTVRELAEISSRRALRS